MIRITHPLRRRQAVKHFFDDISHIGEFYKKMKKQDVSTSGLAYEIFGEFFLKRFEEILPVYTEGIQVAPECNPGYDFYFMNENNKKGIIECKWKSNLKYKFSVADLASFIAEKHDMNLPATQTILFTNVMSPFPYTETADSKLKKWLTVIDGKTQLSFIRYDRYFWTYLRESMYVSCK